MNHFRRAAVAALIFSASAGAQDAAKLETPAQKFSYTVGLQLGDSLKNRGLIELDFDALALGIQDYLSGNDLKLTPQEMQQAITNYQQVLLEKRIALAKKNRDQEVAFLTENKLRDGVVVLDSGVQYEVISEGTGERPTETDTVVVHYRGFLIDGTEFDSSFSRGEPTELEVSQVIAGWQQALQLMKVGGKWKVWIPSDLAYGLRGAGNKIGPNEMLSFDIELIEIKDGG